MKFLLCTAILLVSVLTGFAQQVERIPLADDKTSVVEVTSVFSVIPPCGYAPVRVKAVNDTAADRTITIRSTSQAGDYGSGDHQLESGFTVAAPAGKTTEREFMVPLCADTGGSHYGGGGSLVMIVATGDRSGHVSISAGKPNEMPFAAFSKALAGKNIDDLNTTAASLGKSPSHFSNTVFAALYDASLLPSDWRGYSGLDVLAISADEWTALQPGVKTAILQWVKLGGTLDVYIKARAPGFDALGIKFHHELPGQRNNFTPRHDVGRGSVCIPTWDGRELDGPRANDYHPWTEGTLRRHELGESLRLEDRGVGPGKQSPLVEALGEKSFAAWQVGLILFIFGIMVGPVNLFYFARAGRRHRLFYTTPIISVAAAVLLLVVIFFQDGTGGKGHRASLVYLDAAENTAFVHQLQVSRSGVLFGGSFSTEDAAVVSMAVLPESRWTRLKAGSRSWGGGDRSEAQRYTVSDKSFAGDWFQSRTEQAQIIDSVQSTRGRIELKPASGGAPVISSTLLAPLQRLFYIDAAGKYWASPGEVTTGAEVTLAESSKDDFLAWRRGAVGMLHNNLRQSLAGSIAGGEWRFFYATSSDARAGTVATLESIVWQSDSVFLYGPLAQ